MFVPRIVILALLRQQRVLVVPTRIVVLVINRPVHYVIAIVLVLAVIAHVNTDQEILLILGPSVLKLQVNYV